MSTYLARSIAFGLAIAAVLRLFGASAPPPPAAAERGASFAELASGPARRALDEFDPLNQARSQAAADAWVDAVLAEQDPTDPFAAIDTCVTTEMAQTETPGASIAIMRDGELVYTKGYGVKRHGTDEAIDAGTMFRIGSTTKQMVAAGVMQQVEAGKVDLQAPITGLIPELELAPPWDPAAITTEQLLTHSAGIPDRVTIADFDSDTSP